MKILDYNDVHPLSVLNLTMLALDFPFTPEYAAHIRRTDPRPFPCLTINAVHNELVLGQVGLFRLPFISTEGREDVGGVWAVSTHPQYTGRGIASTLLDEAHSRMRESGLRFSTLGTNRYRVGYRLYQKQGYVDMNTWSTAFNSWELAHKPTRLRAQGPGLGEFDFIEKLFDHLSAGHLGFAWRYTPFAPLREKVKLEEIWVVWENTEPVGFAFANQNNTILNINVQMLRNDTSVIEAVAAIVSKLKSTYVMVTSSRPSDIASFQSAGWQVAHPTWDAFMVKPLVAEVTLEETRRLFGLGTDRFLISWLDLT